MEEKPTLSPQSNRLLEMCQGLLDGDKTPEELSSLLEEMYEGLEKARNDFVSQYEAQDEEYAQKMADEMELVLASFEDYHAALDKISAYFSDNNTNHIVEGMEMIIQATNAMLDMLTVYESKSLQIGPTSFPILNMLILLSDGFKKGDIPEDEFRFMIYNASQFFHKMIDEAESYDREKAKDAIETLKSGYEKFILGLEKLDEGAETHNDLLIDDGLEIIRESQEIIKSGYDKFNEEMFMAGPTESPFTNILISTIEGVREGHFPKELLAENLAKYQEHMDDLRIDVEGISSLPIENEEITEELPKTIQAFDISDEACDLIRQYLQDDNMAHLESAVEKLKKSTRMLKESHEKYEEIGEREGKIACVKCGNLNDSMNNVCSSCGAILPKIVGEAVGGSTFAIGESGEIGAGDYEDFVMTENFKKLVDDSARVRDGKITIEEYNKTLDWMENLLLQGLKKAEHPPVINLETIPEEAREEAAEQKKMAEETIELLREGINEFLGAIGELRLFQEDQDVEHLRTGLQIGLEASIKLQQVQKIGEIAEAELAKIEAEESEKTEEGLGYISQTDMVSTSEGLDTKL